MIAMSMVCCGVDVRAGSARSPHLPPAAAGLGLYAAEHAAREPAQILRSLNIRLLSSQPCAARLCNKVTKLPRKEGTRASGRMARPDANGIYAR